MVGAEGFEPPTLCSQSRCATRLRYAPTRLFQVLLDCSASRIECGTFELERHKMLQLNGDGGYSSAAERLTVAQDVVGSIPTSRPSRYKRLRPISSCSVQCLREIAP
jgi:hypothetical protein